jgi:hypothetical protein
MIAFHRAFEMGYERRTFDRQIFIVFHKCSFVMLLQFDFSKRSAARSPARSIRVLCTYRDVIVPAQGGVLPNKKMIAGSGARFQVAYKIFVVVED